LTAVENAKQVKARGMLDLLATALAALLVGSHAVTT
jgi:hypothetical protein